MIIPVRKRITTPSFEEWHKSWHDRCRTPGVSLSRCNRDNSMTSWWHCKKGGHSGDAGEAEPWHNCGADRINSARCIDLYKRVEAGELD